MQLEASATTERGLQHVALVLRQLLKGRPLRGYLEGKTWMRDRLVDVSDLSVLAAETAIDRLEGLGWIAFRGDPGAGDAHRATWAFVAR